MSHDENKAVNTATFNFFTDMLSSVNNVFAKKKKTI